MAHENGAASTETAPFLCTTTLMIHLSRFGKVQKKALKLSSDGCRLACLSLDDGRSGFSFHAFFSFFQ